jgi:hypothetical protein
MTPSLPGAAGRSSIRLRRPDGGPGPPQITSFMKITGGGAGLGVTHR